MTPTGIRAAVYWGAVSEQRFLAERRMKKLLAYIARKADEGDVEAQLLLQEHK